MLTTPTEITELVSNELKDSLKITWKAVAKSEQTANTAYTYEINGDVQGETDKTIYSIRKISKAKRYTFRVRGHNDCGVGPYS